MVSRIFHDLGCLIEALEGLEGIIRNIVGDSQLSDMILDLERRFEVFQEVRFILAQEDKSGAEIKGEIEEFLNSLKSEGTPGEIYEILEKRFRRYERELYIAYDDKYVPRTNNDLEDFNNCLKRPIRKRQGQKDSWFFMEHQGVPASYYHNLLYAPHVVGGADINYGPDQTPLERIGVLDTISMTSIMRLINRDALYKTLDKNERRYTVHRWTRRLFKRGVEKCLASLDSKWRCLMERFVFKTKLIKGGETSSS